MTTLKAVIFDMDETLIDWRNCTQQWEAYQQEHLGYVFEYVNAQVSPLENQTAFYEAVMSKLYALWNEARETLRSAHFGDVIVETLAEQGVPRDLLDVEACLNAYQPQLMEGVVAFPEVGDVLTELQTHGLSFGIATNSLHPMSMRDAELEAVGLLPYFEDGCRLSAADVGYIKPHPRIFEESLKQLDSTATEAVFVGDNRHADIGGAQQVGMKAVLRERDEPLPYTFEYADEEIIPDGEISTLDELLPLFDRWYPDWRKQ